MRKSVEISVETLANPETGLCNAYDFGYCRFERLGLQYPPEEAKELIAGRIYVCGAAPNGLDNNDTIVHRQRSYLERLRVKLTKELKAE